MVRTKSAVGKNGAKQKNLVPRMRPSEKGWAVMFVFPLNMKVNEGLGKQKKKWGIGRV